MRLFMSDSLTTSERESRFCSSQHISVLLRWQTGKISVPLLDTTSTASTVKGSAQYIENEVTIMFSTTFAYSARIRL